MEENINKSLWKKQNSTYLPRNSIILSRLFGFLCILIQLQLAKGSTLNYVGVQADPSTIQTTNTQLIIFGTLLNPIPSGGSIQINAPSEVSINSGSLTCSFVLPLSGVRISSCIASSRKITIILGAILGAEAFEIHINSVMTNPLSTSPTSSFTIETFGTTSALIDQLSTGINLIATEGIIQTTKLTPASNVVGATTNLEIRFKATHSIPVGAQIKVTFPKWNPLATSPQEYLQGGISCITRAVLQVSLQCSFASSVLTVTGAVGTAIAGGTEVAFNVTSFRNPLSTTEVSGFSILIVDSSGGNIDRGSATAKVTQAAVITNAAVTVDSSVSSSIAGIVQETNKLRLTFNRPVPLNPSCSVKVLLPSQFSVSSITSILVSGFGNSQTSYTPTKSSLDNSFSFTDCTSYTTNTQAGVIIIDSLKLPNYNKPTGSFQIIINAQNGDTIATVTSGVTFTASPGEIQSVALVATTPTILATTPITFTIVPKHTLDVSTRVTAIFPTGYVLGSSCTITPSASINAAASCSFSGQTITINNFLPTVYIGGSNAEIKFTLGSITLPQTTETLSGLSISLLNQDSADSVYYLIDTITRSVPITIGFGTINAVNVIPALTVAFATTSYTFEITPEHYIPQNGYIQITYPSDISIPDASYSQSQCSGFSSTFTTTPTCVVDTTARTITINNGFRQTSFPPGGTKFSFTIPGIVNPLNLGNSGTFAVKTFTQSGQIMDQKLSGIIVTMTTTAFMKSVLVTLGSYINSAITSYTFQITPTVPVTESHLLVIQFPPEVTLPTSESSLSCSSSDTAIFNSATCTFNKAVLSNSIKIALDLKTGVSQINILQTFKITVNGIKNPPSTKQTSDFLVKVTDRSQNDINKSPTGISVSTNTPYTLRQSSLKQNNTGAGQNVQVNITLYPENDILIGGGLYLSYPSQISNSSEIKVTVISAYTKSTPKITITPSSRQILMKEAFQLKVVGATVDDTILIVLTGFQNPRLNTASTSFVVKTFNEETVSSKTVQYYVDQVTDGLILNSPCDYPCATCTASLASNCTSCYPTSLLNKLQGGTCVSECALGKFYNTKTSMCENCQYPCLGCNVTSTNCTACGYQDYLYLHQGKCQGTCPNGFVKDSQNNKCANCNSECATCDLNPSTCTACSSASTFKYLYQATCKSSCPASVTITRPTFCEVCDPICKTCSGSPSFCTTCESFRKFDPLLNTCSQACQENIQIYNSTTGQCMNCDGNCQTCSGTTKTCTSCNNNLVLNSDNICKSTCSALDQTPINNICKQCELPCSQCKGSLNHCVKCQADYLLFNTTCVQYCPEKYEPNNSTGQCILVGLICPEGFTVNEAGDGCIPNEFECPEGQMINAKRTACVPAPGSPVPFPFLIFSIILCLLVLGSYIKDKFFTKVYSNLIALLSFQEMLIYILMLAYSGANGIWGAFVLSLIAILMLMTANIMFYLYYKKEILMDEVFAKWIRSFPRTSKYIPLIALFINFKCIRLYYSGFYGLESCLAQFENPLKNFFRPLRMLTYFNYIFVYIPVFIADIIIFAQVKWGYQLLILGIESFLLTIAIIILTYFEFRDPKKLINQGDEAYSRIKPRHFNGESMVMSGMVDIDESTLIRSKVVDDEYEIFLRKKAFVSILNQVGKNYFTAQEKGLDLGGKIDQVMTKFDENRLKLRRAFSLEDIKEEDSWYIPSDGEKDDTMQILTKIPHGEDEDDKFAPRRYSYPLSPKSKVNAPDPLFRTNLKEIKEATQEQLDNNVYAECKAPDKNKEKNRRKTVSRRTQTYLRELLQIEGDDLHESDLEIIMEDEAEIDLDYTKDLIDNVIDGISESESNLAQKKRVKKKRKNVNNKRRNEIPDFELADIMGDFEIDDLGNFIILRGEKGELLDKKERRVNRRGYLIDRFGNIINKMGQVIFKAVELDSDDEIPAPFGFEKRKKNLLNLGQDGEFRVQGNDKEIEDDEDLIDRELRVIKKISKKKKTMPDGQIVEEEGDNEDGESSVDSLMAESPGKYQLDQFGENEDDIITNVTKKKIPIRRAQKSNKRLSPTRTGELSPQESKQKAGPLQNLPPKRIKREDTREMFPSLAVEASQQKKLFKIAEQIGGMANQIAESQKKNQSQDFETLSNTQQNQERLEKLKQEHFKDIIGESQLKQSKLAAQATEKKLPPKPTYDKIYGNLGDVVNYEEQLLKEQYKGARAQSPFSSQMTSRMGFRPEASTIGGDKRKIRGLESIYLQKFDKKAGLPGAKRQQKAKFRNTLHKFVDDPEMLLDDGIDRIRENEMSLKVADKLDRLQRQYMSNTSTNHFHNASSVTNMAIQPTVGAAIIRKNGSLSGSLFNHDPSLEPIKKGNWVQKD